MVKTNTQLTAIKSLISKVLTIATLLILTISSEAQQYTQPTHYYGCSYNRGTAVYTRYASIDKVIIEDLNGNVIYSKAADGCNASPNGYNIGHYNVTEPTSAFNLSAGSTYKITVGASNANGSTFYTARLGAWIDYNGDKDFADAGEWISPNGILIPHNGTRSFNFTVPCGGTTGTVRLRLRTNYQYGNIGSGSHSLTGTQFFYGETEDFACDYVSPANTIANFVSTDSTYVGTPVKFNNTNQSGYISHNWSMDGASYNSTNVTHVFSTAGTYNVKLVSENCNGKDSITKTIKIVTPTAPPVSDFVADKSVYEIFETVQLTDLSSNGATYWNWVFVNSTTLDTIDGDDIAALRGGDPFVNKNPSVITGNFMGAVPIGVWDLYLTASNSIGAGNEVKKVKYVTVQRSSYNMGAGTALPANVISVSAGTIYDDGGPTGNYGNSKTTEALIAPCGAASVSLDFTSFDLNANATIKIYDGVNALGTPLHTGNGFTAGNEPSGTIT